jgi:N-acetylglucosamine-6-phosphate deacetylase
MNTYLLFSIEFHHRDPGLVGLLGLRNFHDKFFYSMIVDGQHSHPASVNIAYQSHPKGCKFLFSSVVE